MAHVQLCVNVDHIATLRQARGGKEPDPIQGAIICEENGAAGITVHLREDRRHIQDYDVFALRSVVKGKFNLEMALSDEIIAIALKAKPDQITLVPEKRKEITTEGGLDVKKNFKRICEIVSLFHNENILVSLFIEPEEEAVKLSKETGADFIELHTGTYCNARDSQIIEMEKKRLFDAAKIATSIGIRVNAGHGLNYINTAPILNMPGLEELNIGHSIISRSIFTGLANAVSEMVKIISERR
ncbi:MAG: pyridoxine 5'-phosphate synthase [Spirochaetes bacterium]|nr:pyridoxine 5'-phosphate synthase [Spirochaetota bacterium]